jgi:segregation and condensation protein B
LEALEGAAVAEAVRLAFPEEAEAEATHQAQLREALRIAEALLFAATEPLEESEIARRLPEGVSAGEALAALKEDYAHRGVNLVRVNKRWFLRTASDLAWLLSRETIEA